MKKSFKKPAHIAMKTMKELVSDEKAEGEYKKGMSNKDLLADEANENEPVVKGGVKAAKPVVKKPSSSTTKPAMKAGVTKLFNKVKNVKF
jgi:hypothetical protein